MIDSSYGHHALREQVPIQALYGKRRLPLRIICASMTKKALSSSAYKFSSPMSAPIVRRVLFGI